MREKSQQLLPVCVVIPVRNEEKNLAECLSRLEKFERVVVLDSNSTDRTIEIARKAGVEVQQFSWNGEYPKKRNWFLIEHPPEQPWVFFLDADEYVSEEFCKELATVLPTTRHSGFWLNYTNYFLGKALNHGVPQRKFALFKTGSGLYEKIEETSWSTLDMEVHEHPIVNGTTGEISSLIDHRDFRGLEKFIERHLDYAKWEAKRHALLHSTGLGKALHLTKAQRFKYTHLSKWWYPAFYFAYAYIVRLGVLDGVAGFNYAYYKAWYFQTIKRLIIEERKSG